LDVTDLSARLVGGLRALHEESGSLTLDGSSGSSIDPIS
jgi:hypothetical protein